MVQVLLLSDAPDSALPALELLTHRVRRLPAEAASLAKAPEAAITLLDARESLPHARALCQIIRSATNAPLVLIVNQAGLAALNESWQADDFVLIDASPGEVDARLRLVAVEEEPAATSSEIRAGGIAIDEATYTATINGRLLNLTFKEFELLKHLALYPGQVFTRDRLLHEVWGYDYFGGTRTVDVHIRRLRAKLGADHESLIGTVRNVGYRLVVAGTAPLEGDSASTEADIVAESS